MTTNEAIAYAKRKSMNDISPEEDAQLKNWIEYSTREEYIRFSDALIIFMADQDGGMQQAQAGSGDAGVRYLNGFKKQSGYNQRKVLQVAALVLLLVGSACWLFIARSRREHDRLLAAQQQVPPVNIKPSLTLPNGAVYTLDSPAISVPRPVDYTELIILDSARQRHRLSSAGLLAKGIEFAYNSITVPAGRQYKVKLPDGTLVWLNAASSIRYPVTYNAYTRHVEITGEAYLEVAPDSKKPFAVKAGNTNVKVLGTRFTVRAYENEGEVRTTLLQGAIAVTGDEINQQLKVGQEATVYNGQLSIVSADTIHAGRWKEGYFDWQQAILPAMMRDIERWYGVKAEFDLMVPPGSYTGTISRNIALKDLITLLTYAGVNISQQGNTLKIGRPM